MRGDPLFPGTDAGLVPGVLPGVEAYTAKVNATAVDATLGDRQRGDHPGRTSDAARTVHAQVGLTRQDPAPPGPPTGRRDDAPSAPRSARSPAAGPGEAACATPSGAHGGRHRPGHPVARARVARVARVLSRRRPAGP